MFITEYKLNKAAYTRFRI